MDLDSLFLEELVYLLAMSQSRSDVLLGMSELLLRLQETSLLWLKDSV